MDIVIHSRPRKRKLVTSDQNTCVLMPKSPNNHATPVTKRFCALSNMGNTCYLNSVLYALRFTPNFLHDLHHVMCDLTKLKQYKAKALSLGRNINSTITQNNRSSSSRDLTTLCNNDFDLDTKWGVHRVTEKLHCAYKTLRNRELELSHILMAYSPVDILQAVREANGIFQDHRQQDAHELLVYLLGNIQDTCDIIRNEAQRNPHSFLAVLTETTGSKLKLKKSFKKSSSEAKSTLTKDSVNGVVRHVPQNFIKDHFEGVSLVRTQCCECEQASECREKFFDIPVALVKEQEFKNVSAADIFGNCCIYYEYLGGNNKYFCENCCRYNEAIIELRYEKLPDILIIQLKRFQMSDNNFEKITSYFPTPLEINCFCHECRLLQYKQHDTGNMPEPVKLKHRYRLCCAIVHLGSTAVSGHYVAYVRLSDNTRTFLHCTRTAPNEVLPAFNNIINMASGIRRILRKPLPDQNATSSKDFEQPMCNSVECCSLSLNKINETWLECNDELLRRMTTSEFLDIIDKKNSTATPYLLFYEKY